ncbi:MAG: hypothetical protein GQ542_00945 [Desulforhopalus sp.]|nr:hypothetical protein [Desulforhopalus sp.]
MKKNIFFLLLTFLVTSFCFESKADWINLTGAENARNIAEIYIEKDQVTIKLEVFVQDLPIFEELVPDDFFPNPFPNRPGPDERLQTFADSVFQVITDTGEKLSAKLLLAEPRMRVDRPSPLVGSINPYTRQRIPGPPEDKRVFYAELIYPFKGQPESLTFIPPVSEDGNIPKTSIGFTCYHQGVPVVDFRQLTAQNTLNLEWDDPWYSAFEKKPLKRTLQSGVRTYLYIEPYEVRHEILVRVKDMMTWMDFDLRGDEYIEEDEFNPVREKMAQFFMDREKVMIDGKQGKPILDRTAYVESSMLRSRFIEIPERVPLNTAMVGIIITYLTDTIPGEVVTQWDLFSDRVQKVTASMVDPAGPFPYDLTPDDNVLKWTNYLKTYTIPTVDKIPVDATHKGISVPLGSLACMVLLFLCTFLVFRRRQKSQPVKVQLVLMLVLLVGIVMLFPQFQISIGDSARASQISEDDSKVIALSLLENVYRAFDFRDEEDVYDKLAKSVNGDLLTDIYLQSRKSLVIEQAGGAQAKIKEVAVLETEVQETDKDKGAVAIRTKWTATGSVGHWGHLHTRQNVYDAILTLAVADGFWKISGIELLEEKRVDSTK